MIYNYNEKENYFIIDYGDDIKIYQRPKMVQFVGANMVYRKEVFDKYGLFETNMGVGKGLMGEDTDMFNRLFNANEEIYYCGKASVYHPVEEKRMSLFYIAKWQIAYGKYLTLIRDTEEDKQMVFYFKVPRYLFRQVAVNFLSLLFKVFNKREFLKQWILIFCDIGKIQQYRSL